MFGEEYSESPRLPSPWEAASIDRPGSDCARYSPPRCLIPESDLHGHIEYKLRLPAYPTTDRLARLTSQLKWRLLEGGGEAIYEIGICDNGLLLGIDRNEMDSSVRTLERMAEGLGAEVKILREVEVEIDKNDVSLKVCEEQSEQDLTRNGPDSDSLGKDFNDTGNDRSAASGVSSLSLPMLFHQKKAITKRQRRQMRRDRDTIAQSMAKDGAENNRNKVVNGLDKCRAHGECYAHFDETQREEGRDWVQARHERRDGEDSSISSFDDLPSLSSSPSPPIVRCTCTRTHISIFSDSTKASTSLDPHMPSTLVTSEFQTTAISRQRAETSTEDLYHPGVVDPAEEDRLRIRRHLRKAWKKERKQQKLEFLSHATGSRIPSSLFQGMNVPSTSSNYTSATTFPEIFEACTPEDRFMDGLVALFDGVVLDDVEPFVGLMGKRQKKRTKHILRDAHLNNDAEERDLKVPQVVSDTGQKQGKGRRFAVECLVYHPDEGGDSRRIAEGDLSFNHERKSVARAKAPTLNYIDFEGLFDVL